MVRDAWVSGDQYEPYIGRWSRLVARGFLRWLDTARDLDWLDVGSGTGALSEVILGAAAPRSVVGVDASAGYVAHSRASVTDSRASFELADAQALPFADASFDVVVSGLMLNFVPDPGRAVREMARVVGPAGTVAAYVWDYAKDMQLIRAFWDAAVELDADAADLDEGRRFPICEPGALEDLWTDAGMEDVEARAVDVRTSFADFDDYWSPFLGGQGPAPGYAISLDVEKRELLRQRIRHNLPLADDGSIELLARAWAVRGTR